MLRRPRLKPHYTAEVVEGEGVFLLSERHQVILQGSLYETIIPLLDGRPVESIRKQLAPGIAPARIFYTLNRLEQGGYLCEAEQITDPERDAFWTGQDLAADQVRANREKLAVSVASVGLDAGDLRALLESCGLRLDEASALEVVVTDQYLRDELLEHDRKSRQLDRPWLLVKPTGTQIWIGPLFRPGQTACWSCLIDRLEANTPISTCLATDRAEGYPVVDRGSTPASRAVAIGLIANAVEAFVATGGDLPHLEGAIWTLDLVNGDNRFHHLLRLPACPECGSGTEADETAFQPIIPRSQKKVYSEDGGHRTASPQETINRYEHLVSPLCGAVSVLERASCANNSVLHVYLSGHNLARGADSVFQLQHDLRNSSAGKGITEEQARASALCEGLERYSASVRGDKPRRTARLVDLGDQGVHPNRCMLFSEAQYKSRIEQPVHGPIFNRIPAPFDPERKREWSPVWSLTHECVRYLPFGFCYFNPEENAGEEEDCLSCSNGNAAGNTLEEAILQGFCELVERDSVALWWYNRVQVPAVDLDSFHEPYLDRLRAFFATKGRDLWMLDLTTDLEIPSYAAISRRVGAPAEHIMFGFGAHFDPRIAMLRAVTELNQMLAHILDAPPEGDLGDLNDPDTVNWLQNARYEEHTYLQPRPGPLKTLGSYAYQWTDDLKDDIETCVTRVRRLGFEMLVLDQTRPEIGLPVAKVMVPGLRHFWPRFAPGRLFDTPVELDWLRTPRTEADFNPIPMFL